MTCPHCTDLLQAYERRCADLEEQNAWLRRELGYRHSDATIGLLSDALRRGKYGGRVSCAKMLATLYGAGGNVVSKWQLMDATSDLSFEDERDSSIVKVWITHIRSALGFDAIENVWGKGYRLSPSGMAKVSAVLGAESKAPPTGQGEGLTSALHVMLRPGE